MKPSTLLNPQTHNPIITQKLTLNCPILNQFLAGGIPCNSITEFVAESGSGKTQICLQLLLSAQLPTSLGGLSAASLFIYTEFPFPHRRLRQLSISFVNSNIAHFNPMSCDPLDNILTQGVHNADQLFDVLLKSEFENTRADLRRRSSLFFKISGKLRALSDKFGLVVVVTNQVVDFVGFDDGINGLRMGNLKCLFTSGRRVCPALGLAWSNCVTIRLFLSKNEEVLGERSGLIEEDGRDSVCLRTRRHLHVVFAPHLPPSSCEIIILREGVFGVDSSDQFVTNKIQ